MIKKEIYESAVSRRDFLKCGMAAGAGLVLPLYIDVRMLSAAETSPDLVVVQGTPAAALVKTAVDGLGGMGRFVSKGAIVVVKPNIGWDRRPEFAATTNPEVVASVVRLCYEAGAKKVKVFDRTVNDARRCYEQSGIAEAAGAEGAEVSYTDERKFKDVKIKGMALDKWPLYTELLEADSIINIPIAKTHGLADLTMAMKNWMGVMGGRRGRIHQRLDESLVDLARIIKPALTILDAVRILTGSGPQGGRLEDVKTINTIVAGVDQVAVDSFGATLFGMKGENLGYLRLAQDEGLGTMDLTKTIINEIKL
ncbi:MAG: DUF362 domain-containing protein [Syntrophales bacterium]|jgi:uncharacterized protein (DUF362 family)|nr:DUF362 domain-containing protein [Syntrophales bacterium]MDY0045698.1 DUF362 domain-containing protein [Syntrophales bacterium]